MSLSDPIVFAARAGRMTDTQLYDTIHQLKSGEGLSDFHQVVLDETRLRGILTASEADAITASQRPV